MREEGKKKPISLPLPLQASVLQTPQAELGFSTLNPIKSPISLAGSTDDTVSLGSGASGLEY